MGKGRDIGEREAHGERGGRMGRGEGGKNTRRKEGKGAGQNIGNKKVHEERVTNREK